MKWQEYPYYFEGLEKQLERIHEKKRELDKKRPIPTYVLKSIKDSLSIEWTVWALLVSLVAVWCSLRLTTGRE